MRSYKCNKCGKVVKRGKQKGKYPLWIPSYCAAMGQTTRLYRQKEGDNRGK